MSASPDIDEEFLNRAVVVTGAAGIIGGWIADAFFRRGARLVLSDRRGDRLEADRDRGRWGSSEVVLHSTDLRDPRSVDDLVRTVEATVGAPYAVVNNAGIYPHRPLLDVDLDHWDSVMETNVTAPYLITTGMARLMIAAGVAGSIVNIASGAATSVSPGGVAYSVSKAALVMLTRGAALELAPHRIRVNAVGPGFVPGSEVSTLDDQYVKTMTASIPLGRTSGPEDAPEMVVYLCSTRAGFVTGNLIHVDGGRAAGPVGTKR